MGGRRKRSIAMQLVEQWSAARYEVYFPPSIVLNNAMRR
jgi:hypothetical protein